MKNRERLRQKSKEKYHATKHLIDKKRKYQDSARRNRLKRTGFTEDLFNRAIELQGGRCAVCERVLLHPHADHCHETKTPRGVLCPRCNMGIGLFGDREDVLRRASDYLSRPTLHGQSRGDVLAAHSNQPRHGQLHLWLEGDKFLCPM